MTSSSQAVNAQTAPAICHRSLAAPSPLALWHLLSLDAPTVAALWTWFIARVTHVPLSPTIPAAMFLAVWLLYAADRLLDARLLDTRPNRVTLDRVPHVRLAASPQVDHGPATSLEPRHLFHLRHRRFFLAATPLVGFALLALLPLIPRQPFRLYLLLGALLAAWFAIIHTRATPETLPKELALGPFFAAAVFIPSFASLSWRLFATTGAFAILCTLNCLYIYAWEHESRRAPSIAPSRWVGTTAVNASTNLCLRFLTPISLLAITLPILFIPLAPALAPIQLTIASAAALLLLLHRFHPHLDPTHLRAAADLVLLTPLLLAPWLR